ncbi:2-oxo acid dehydrogenase subunit E2 [Pokkaliibacter sp. MBI-7]|uniref:dihydrolipoamide acetyltransferase family protein n=1 Tax=Pokkaliibacter sp. MBI-7 TaxID=3040600 RepID=UPI002449C611|nr:2-oxo acid dehydrogenase subunit E2 [Pokkaliibacter sp. MBI-7]MDH2435909.1 2-oxo acid dehydrogenase subunit E2 [Pokkaliibacter sp. MBI-7]
MGSMINVRLPAGQLEGTAATLLNWLVRPGEKVQKDQPLVELETDKVTMEVASPADGFVDQLLLDAGAEVTMESILAILSDQHADDFAAETPTAAQPAVADTLVASVVEPSTSHPLLSPAVRRLAKQHQLDLHQLSGSGKGGRITKSDVLNYLSSAQAQPSAAASAPQQAMPALTQPVQQTAPQRAATHAALDQPAATGNASSLRPHTPMRKRIAEHMVDSLLHTAPHVTSIFELDMTAIQRHRAAHKDEFARHDVKLSFTPYFVAAAVKALQQVPEVNSQFHPHGLELFHDCNIGVGTALGNDGLVVPVIRQAQDLNLLGIARRLQQLTQAAYDGSLKPADMKGGTFTISNHGVSGSLVATPIIINQPQTAILGIGKMQKRVVVKELDGIDTMVIRPMCYVTLTIDHRALDGYQTNTFLSVLVDMLENWA